MADTIPLRYAQSLLRLSPLPDEELRRELVALNLPLVLLQNKGNADARIQVEDYGRLFIHLVRKLQQHLPSNSGNIEATLLFSSYRMMFQAMLHSANLEQAMQRSSVYFQRLQAGGESVYLEQNGDSVCCRFEFAQDSQRSLQAPENFSMEQLNWLPGLTGHLLSMAMWHRVCSWFAGGFIELEAVEMSQPPRRDKNYTEIFGTPVQFKTGRNALCFHRRYLSFPIIQSEASLTRMLETYPAELLKINPRPEGIVARVKGLIGRDFENPLPTLQNVADRLYMTTPTLHRRLREEGTSFQQLKDACRKNAAIDYLANGNLTTQQLAELMGFSDSSTFHRAFKKWTGLTPTEYRVAHC